MPLSTILVAFNRAVNREKDEDQIQLMLKGIVFNSGNWKKSQLSRINHKKLKHTSKSPQQWAERILEKLSLV